jgi:hypothetical protein
VSVINRRAWARWLTVIALTLGLSSLPSTASALSAPGALAPTDAVSSNTPTLSWGRPSGAVRFEVQVDDTDTFSSPSFTSSTTNTRAVPTSLLGNGEQWLRVRAFTAAGAASSWSVASFEIDPLAAPTPTSPVNGDLLAQPDDPALLAWSSTQGATEYTVQVDKEGDWVGSLEYKTETTSLVIPDPLEAAIGESGTTYHWRVRARKATGVESAWSDEATFAVMALDEVEIVRPDDSPDNQIEDVVLDWNPVRGAQYYELRVATNQDFTTVVDTRIKVLGTRFSPPETYKNNQYYWQVRAVDLSGNPTDWSHIEAQFSRVWPDTPEAVYPAEPDLETVSGDLYYQWTPVQHASQYELHVGHDAGFSPGTFETCLTAGTTYTPFLGSIRETNSSSFSVRPDEDCLPTPGGVTYWRVMPLDRPQPGTPDWVYGMFSETQSFRYNPAAETTFSPADGATVAVPTLSWDQIGGAHTYEIDIQDRFGTNVKSNIKTRATSYTPVNVRLKPENGPFSWFLTAVSATGKPISLRYQHHFNLEGEFDTTGVAPLTPLSGRATDPSSQLPPSLSWEPMKGAETYRIFAGPAGSGTRFSPVSGDALEKKLYYPRVTDTWTWFLTSGSYDWRVQAYDASGQIIGTGPMATFTIGQIPAVTGTRIALDGSALDSGFACARRIGHLEDMCTDSPATPVFDWAPVPGASLYMLYLSEDASFTNTVEPLDKVPATTNTRWAPTLSSFRAALPDTQAGDAYYWFVRPCRAITSCAPSPVGKNGMATNKFRKRSPGVLSVSPGVGVSSPQNPAPPKVGTVEITFDWEDYFVTNQGFTWAATEEKSPQAAMQYRIQVNDSPTFSNTASQNVDDIRVDQSTYTAFSKLYPDKQLYWRVQAIDAEGNGLSWSTTRTFEKSSPAVALLSPVDGDAGAGTRAFEWEAQAYAASYQIEVAKNNDPNFSSTNRLFPIKTVKQTAYSWTQPIPHSSQRYWWRVRRIDPSGNVGAWSTARSFRSNGEAPSLDSPADDSTQPADGPLFTWSEVPGATTYTLDVRKAGSTSNWATITTAANAWATLKSVPSGSWNWRVTAKDSDRNALGASQWWSFDVQAPTVPDTTKPTVTSYSPTSSARAKANVKASFSEAVARATVNGKSFQLKKRGTKRKVRARVTTSSDGLRAVLNPNRRLRRGTYYTATLTSGITDRQGNSLTAKTWTFRVR